jgi:hypothetical protein
VIHSQSDYFISKVIQIKLNCFKLPLSLKSFAKERDEQGRKEGFLLS